MKWISTFFAGFWFASCLLAADTPGIKLGILDPHRSENLDNGEFLQYDRMVPVYRAKQIEPSQVKMLAFSRGNATEEQIYQILKPFHVIVLTNTYDSSLRLTAELQALAVNVRGGLRRFIADGGGLLILPQGLRYPGDDDIRYWNLVFAEFGCQIMPEGVFDPTRAFPGRDLAPTTYWLTQNITIHPVAEGVKRLCLPLYPTGHWPGVPLITYSPDWQVIVSGEKTAKSFLCANDNVLDLKKDGACPSAPPVVACRTLGKGRIVCFPLAYPHTGPNYNVPIWDNTVETRGDKAAGLPSDTLKLLLNALKWLGEPALAVPELGGHVNPPGGEVQYPPTVAWDQVKYDAPGGNGVRGIVGAVSANAGGQGSVAEFAQAAKAAGLAFIVFADPLEKLTPDAFAKLLADCAAVSGTGEFYACPGIEFADGLGNRWAFWGEKIVYPEATFKDPYYPEKSYTQWDGKKIHHYGRYSMACRLGPSALLDYKQLRANGAHPENLWWFYDYFPLVFDRGRLVADNYAEFLHGLNDLRWAAVASFTRVGNPSEVATAATTCFTGFSNLEAARKALNSRCNAQFLAQGSGQYVSQGPVVRQWQAINQQMESNWAKTRGAQRVRLKFAVSADQGIADVKIHDGERGLFRRFLGNGEKQLTREFECVQDQQHYLTLEVTDTAGKRAFSWVVIVWSYKQGLARCGDNLNILGATGMCWHPDRNQMTPIAKQFENGMNHTLFGWDTEGYLCPMPRSEPADTIQVEGAEGPTYPKLQECSVSKILEVPLSSYNLQIATQTMQNLAERWDTPTRPGPALCTVLRDLGPLQYFERIHTIYAPATRTDWYTAWNHSRPREGARDYRGGFIWHEGKITITKDVTLKGDVPIPLVRMSCPLDLAKGWGDLVIVTDADGRTRVARLTGEKEKVQFSGRLRPGGYASVMPSLVGYEGFFAPTGSEFTYKVQLPGWVTIGLGTDQQAVKAGTEFTYRFAFGSFADARAGNGLLEDTAAALNMDGGANGYPVVLKAGKLVAGPFFCTVTAEKNEAAFKIGPRDLIIDLPFRIQGLEDNGCAAVYNHAGRKWFRFVPVVAGTAWFQEPILPAADLWTGNIFVADNKSVKITVVVDGQVEGKKPFLEVHNPTDTEIRTRVVSPPHTPVFGGIEAELAIPAGDTVRAEINGKKLMAQGKP